MRADLKLIQSNDYPSWDDFVAACRTKTDAKSGWFSVEVGADDGEPDGEWFQVLVCTRDGAAELRKKQARSRYVIADAISPEGVSIALRDHISRIRGVSWFEVREALRKSMWWERETVCA